MIEKPVCKIVAISVVLALIASSAAVFSATNLGAGEKGIEVGGERSVISLEMLSMR